MASPTKRIKELEGELTLLRRELELKPDVVAIGADNPLRGPITQHEFLWAMNVIFNQAHQESQILSAFARQYTRTGCLSTKQWNVVAGALHPAGMTLESWMNSL